MSDETLMRNGAGDGQISLLDLVNALLRQRVLLIAVPLICAAVVGTLVLSKPRTWSASAAFMPQSRDQGSSGIAGIAAQFGVAVPGTQPSQSPAFYTELLRSRQILVEVLRATYGGLPAGVALEDSVQRLRERISIATTPQTGLVTVAVQAGTAQKAKTLAEHLIAEVNRFNVERRQSQAAAERTFVQGRVTEAARELAAAENRLRDFMTSNQQLGKSANLYLQRDRLEREVALRQQIYASLSEAYEQARIEEVRNLAVITVVEPPVAPTRPDGRGVVTKVLVALLLGLGAAVPLAFLREFALQRRENREPDFVEFERLLQQIRGEIRNPVRIFRTTSRP